MLAMSFGEYKEKYRLSSNLGRTKQNPLYHTSLTYKLKHVFILKFSKVNSFSFRNILIFWIIKMSSIWNHVWSPAVCWCLHHNSLVCSLPSCIRYLGYRYFKWCFWFEGVNNHRMMRSVLRKFAALRKTIRTEDLRQNALRTQIF